MESLRIKEKREDQNLGFLIRCMVANMIDEIESSRKIVSILPKEILLDHLEHDYIAVVTVKKKHG